jgi:hypothetical protein
VFSIGYITNELWQLSLSLVSSRGPCGRRRRFSPADSSPRASLASRESVALESTTPPSSSVQIPEAPEPAPEASPSKPPGAGIPADAAVFMALKAKEREAQQEERRKQLPGGQIPAKDWFQPEPQEGPEIVRFTRIPGGRGIRRC